MGGDRTLSEGDPWFGLGVRRDAQAGGLIGRAGRGADKNARGVCAFFVVALTCSESSSPRNGRAVYAGMTLSYPEAEPDQAVYATSTCRR